jgi:hypothetical protein
VSSQVVAWWRLLTVEILQLRAQVLSEWWLTSNWLSSSVTAREHWLGCPSCLPYNFSARPTQKTPFILVCISVAAGTCLPSHSLAAAVYSALLRIFCLATDVLPLPRNECCFRAVR